MKRFIMLVSLLALVLTLDQAFAQKDPNDPGSPDSVFFVNNFFYSLPSGPGVGYAHIKIVNDDSVSGISMPFVWSGQVTYDSVTFRDSRVNYLEYKTVNAKLLLDEVLIGAVPVKEHIIPPGRGLFATICFSFNAIGPVSFDTIYFPPANHLYFVTKEPKSYTPRFVMGQATTVQYKPGDVDYNGKIELADAVFLAYYIIQGHPVPPQIIATDVDGNCKVELADVIYLARYIIVGAPALKPGCVWGVVDP